MSHALIVRPDAERDLVQARDWYEERREGLGVEFLTAIDQAFERIRETPELYPAEHKGVRRARLARFPYVVYYRVLEASVEVIAVFHGGRHPRRWRSRA